MIAKSPSGIFDNIAASPSEPIIAGGLSGSASPVVADFSGLISRALNRHTPKPAMPERQDCNSPSQSPPPHTPGAKPRAPHVSRHSTRAADESEDPCRTESQPASPDPREDKNNADPLVANNVTAVLTQPPAPAAPNPELAEAGNSQNILDDPEASVIADGDSTVASPQEGANTGAGTQQVLSSGLKELTEVLTQTLDAQTTASEEAPNPPAEDGDGTTSALNRQRMKSAANKDEIAGRAVQKLPRTPKADVDPDALPQKGEANPDHAPSPSKTAPGIPVSLVEASGKFSATAAQGPDAANGAQPASSTVQIERVTRLVNQEVIMIRQSGAYTLAVALKVDAHTELFLHLTNHDGQIQASIRCERGDVAGLGHHWGQLQESLARQNVQLLPLEQKPGLHNFNQSSDRTASRQFEEPAQNPRQQPRDSREPSLSIDAGAKSAVKRGAKKKNSGRPGWEGWA